jgi:Xaa-Pro aminopeptidase
MAESHIFSLAVKRFADHDMLMCHFGHGIGHLEYTRVHEGPRVRDEGAEEETEQGTEYQNEEGDNVMDLDSDEDDEEDGEPTDESSDGEDDNESGYASF